MKTFSFLPIVVASLLLIASDRLQGAVFPLSINCSTDLVVTATGPGGATVFFTVTASGGCNPPPTVYAYPPSGSTFPIGKTTVNCTASDTCGSNAYCSFTVTVIAPPIVLNCSSNLTTKATSTNGATVFFTVTASGGCSPPPTVNAYPPSGSTFPIGTTTVMATASDTCGGYTNCTFSVTVNPPGYTPIVLNCSSNLTTTATSPNGATVFFTVTASGGCSPPPTVYAYPPSGSTFPIGTTTVMATASDTCGGYTNCSFTVTVKAPVYPPIVLNCPSNLTTTATSANGATVFFAVTASGGCSPPPFVTAYPPSGSTFPIGTTTVMVTASDTCGSNAYCSFTVTVLAPPIVLNCSSNLTVTATSSNGATVFFTVTASGGCSPPPFVSANPPSGSTFPIGTTTVMVTAGDTCGGYTNCSFTVTVKAPVYPPIVLNCPSNLTTTATSANGATVFFTVTASGGCSPPPTVYADPPSGSTFPIGTTTVMATASDTCGNSTNCSFNVTVNSTNIPTADLGITKTASSTNVAAGSQVVFTLLLRNLGPGDVTNTIVVTDCVPPGYQYVSNNALLGGGVYSQGNCQWSYYPGLNANASASLDITTLAVTGGTYTNSATVAVPNGYSDPNLSNNTSSVAVKINPISNLSGAVRGCQSVASAIPLVSLTLSGATNATTLTDTNGFFVFSNLLDGTYTVTPASSNYFFQPTNMVVTIVNSNVTLTNFIGLPRFITGNVLQGGTNGQPVAGVTIVLGGALSRTNLTDTNGVYVFTNLNAGTYTVRPQTNGFPGIRFAPTNATVALGSLTNCPSPANFITTNVIIVLRALEVVQVVQDWSNSVVLVANKNTLVRAHLQLYGTNTTPVLVSGARLYAEKFLLGGANATWAPDNGRITVMTNNCAAPVIRSNLNMSLNFTARDGFKTGPELFRFIWTNGVVINAEPGDVAGDPGSNGQVRVSYNVVPPLGVRFIRVAMTNGLRTNITATATNIVAITNLPTLAQIEEEKRRLISIYPISQITNLAPGRVFWRAKPNAAWADEVALLATMSAQRLTSSDTNGPATNRIWYGVSPQGVVVRGAGYVPGYVSEGCISASPQNYQRHLAAHEIGHNLGRPHAVRAALGVGGCNAGDLSGYCGECADAGTPDFPMMATAALGLMPTLGPLADDNQVIWGYDTYLARVVSPYLYYDLMSYCMVGTGGVGGFPAGSLGPWPWNSKFTYTNIFGTIQARFGPAARSPGPQGPVQPNSQPPPSLLVRGQIDSLSGAVTFSPCYPVASLLPVTPGPFTLVVLDTNAFPLYSLPFAPDVPESEFGSQTTFNTFDLAIPIITGAAAIEIYSNAVAVGELVADAYAPSVQVLHPGGGENFGNTNLVVSWTGSDLDGSPLAYLVQFSPNGGDSWDTLAIDWDQTNLDIPPDTLPATTNGLIRVIASDGLNTYTAQSAGPFTITSHGPAISILQPGSGAVFYGDQTVVLSAEAYDLEDGSLDGTNVVWTSSLDGPLGSGQMLPLETMSLSEGIHLVTATAIASSGLTNSASVQIIVLRLVPPQLSIQLTNSSQILVSWPVIYTNYVLEITPSLAPANWTTVTNRPVTADILQTVNLNLSSTNRFFRLRMP